MKCLLLILFRTEKPAQSLWYDLGCYYKVDPLLNDTLNKGHNTFNLSIKDKFCGSFRTMEIQFYLLIKRGQPLYNSIIVPKLNMDVRWSQSIYFDVLL